MNWKSAQKMQKITIEILQSIFCFDKKRHKSYNGNAIYVIVQLTTDSNKKKEDTYL
ncbi:hypothetical protein MOB1_03960 [Faecalimonas mobilis]